MWGKRLVFLKFSSGKIGKGEYPLKIIFETPKPSQVRRIAPILCVERILCAKTTISRFCMRLRFSREFGFFIILILSNFFKNKKSPEAQIK